ncbi:VanZ family protein [bacterium]|nr:VanZ family protein [bacterium]
MNRAKQIFGILLILWFIASIVTSLLPSDSISIDYILGYDKLLHAIKFIFFSLILYNFLHYSNWSYSHKLMVYIPLQFYPIIDELIQIMAPGRSVSAYDILANYIGVLIGVILSILIRIFIHNKRDFL